ncbi:MAG: ABC transporter ATP-binding protein [Anaerolineaceae bacterium]|nr:ABC transporter ATP-binding protein [Anaerolineaceae bacterium]MBN2677027.1 ABC transporter ATP-binding protein [Anaerolineaceae bacterium]
MLTGYRLKYTAATLSLVVSASARMLTFQLLRYFVDNIFIAQDHHIGLPMIAAGFIGLALMDGGFSFISGRLSAQSSESVTRRLRNYLFDHIQHLPFAYHDQTATGDLIERCTSDVDTLRRFFSDQAINAGRVIILFIINFTAIYQLNPKLAGISIIVIPVILVVSILFFNKIFKAYEAYQEQEAVLSTTLQENLSGVRVVKAFARQPYEISKFDKDNWEKYLRGKKLYVLNSIFWPISDTICSFQILVGLYFGAMLTINHEITIGTYIAYAGMVILVIFPIRNLGRLIVDMSTGLVSYGRVMEIIKNPRESLEDGDYLPDKDVVGAISFKNVGFEYEGDHKVLDDISFECQPGQVIALLGSTGSGKTTLVNLLPRFYEATHGRITLDGIELNRYPRRYLRTQVGIVEQEPFLFSRSIRENITYGVGREVTDEEVENAARAASIHAVIMSFPNGYGTLVGERGVTLSGGQKQRVAIARTLLKNPRILILDDSTSSVDTETEADIRSALDNLMIDRTTFIIAHRIQSIMQADLILVMDGGHIVQRGQHNGLLQEEGIYRQIFNIQTRIEDELQKEIAGV